MSILLSPITYQAYDCRAIDQTPFKGGKKNLNRTLTPPILAWLKYILTKPDMFVCNFVKNNLRQKGYYWPVGLGPSAKLYHLIISFVASTN